VIAGLLVALPLWLATWFTGARSSLILMAGGVAALTLAAVQPWGWQRRAIAAFAAAVVAAVGWLLVSTTVTNVDPQKAQKTPIGRLVIMTPMGSLGEALYEILWSRGGYGLAAVEAIKDHPIVGVGVGRFYTMAPNYHERLKGYRIPPDNAQSLWRHTWAEQGLIGLLPLLWLTGLTALATLSRPIEGKDVVQRVMLASLGVALLVGYPVQDAGIAVTLATLVCAVAGPRRSPST
jgi:hypothetical protein